VIISVKEVEREREREREREVGRKKLNAKPFPTSASLW